MYAIVETGGKQIHAEVGKSIFVEKLDANVDEEVILDKVVLLNNNSIKVGKPYIKGASVKCVVEKQGKAKKILIFKYKAKKASTRRKQGHRQPYTKLLVKEILV